MSTTSLSARDVVLRAHASLGEGPIWDVGSATLMWVDIRAGEVHWFDPVTGTDAAVGVGQAVGAAALSAVDGRVVVAVRDGFGVVDRASGAFHLVVPVEQEAGANRMNDGKCDRRGRFWAGTMDVAHESTTGVLYRLELDGSVTPVITGVGISNGLGWSPDDRRMYYIDSARGTVDVLDFEAQSGAASGRRTLVAIPPADGVPDGMTVDADGYLWVALFGGSSLHRYAADGRLDREVRLPVSLVTSCAFGGPDLADLYVTTARCNGDVVIEDEPYAGDLFRFRPGVRGLPPDPYRGRLQ